MQKCDQSAGRNNNVLHYFYIEEWHIPTIPRLEKFQDSPFRKIIEKERWFVYYERIGRLNKVEVRYRETIEGAKGA